MNRIKMPKDTASRSIELLRPIDDTFMQKLGEDKAFCEEMLRTVLNKPKLKVISNTTQKSIHNIDTRSVTLDIKCMDEDGTVFGVEVQKQNNDDHQKRVRYNGSCVQIQSLDKNTSFKELPDVCMIFITETDFLRQGKTIYHVDRIIRETGEVITNGYTEIYVNAEVDDGSALAEYMKLLTSEDVCYNENFPVICKLTDYYKNGKGNKKMCEVVENYAKKYAKEYAKEYAKDVAMRMLKNDASDEYVINMTGLTPDEVAEVKASFTCEAVL